MTKVSGNPAEKPSKQTKSESTMTTNRVYLTCTFLALLSFSHGNTEKQHGLSVALAESVPLVKADVVHTEYGFTGLGINVAVLDTGIDRNHPDLADSIVTEVCICDGCCPNGRGEGSGRAIDDNGHGTSMAGAITSPEGIAPDAGIVAIKVMNSRGKGDFLDLGAALQWVLFNHRRFDIRVVNMSLTDERAYNEYGECSSAIFDIIESTVSQLADEGVVTFAASGNNALRGVSFPACLPSTIAVGATYDKRFSFGVNWNICMDLGPRAGDITCYTNAGPLLDIVAPGSTILTSSRGGGREHSNGTSVASVHAAGGAALLLQANPSASFDGVLGALRDHGTPAQDFASRGEFRQIDIEQALIAVPEPGFASSLPLCVALLLLFGSQRGSKNG